MNQRNYPMANQGCPYTPNTVSTQTDTTAETTGGGSCHNDCSCPQTTSTESTTMTSTIGGDAVMSSDSFCVDGCCEQVNRDLGLINIANLGQIINVSLTLRNVCPNRKIAIAITLVEIDQCCREHQRAFRVFEIQTPSTPCGNLRVNNLRFAIPVENSCQKRRFRFLITANYSDTRVCM